MKNITTTILVSITLLFVLSAQAFCQVNDTPVVVFRIDDCPASWKTQHAVFGNMSALEYGKLKRIPITWAVMTNFTANGYAMTWDDIRDYLDTAGGEAASHSCSHRSLPKAEDYIRELIDSKNAINAALGPKYQCRTFLQPGPWANEAYMDYFDELYNPIGNAIRANYVQSQAYLGGGWTVGPSHYAYGTSVAIGIDAHNAPTADKINSTLDIVANTPGVIFIVTGHGVQQVGGTTSYSIAADILKVFMDKCAQLRDEGKIRLMSLHDAYHNEFSSNLNRFPDPGVEYCTPGPNNPIGPWTLSIGSTLADRGGLNNSRYVSLMSPNANANNGTLLLAPGRYMMKWNQRVEVGGVAPNALNVVFGIFGPPGYSNSSVALNWMTYYSNSVGVWEMKKAVVIIPEKRPSAYVYFSAPNGFMGIDDISLVSSPVNNSLSVSNITVTPFPLYCTIAWDTPDNDKVSNIQIRCGQRTHPLFLSEGTHLITIPAIRGSRQQVTLPIQWSNYNLNLLFLSLFAVESEERVNEPDNAVIMIDTTPPSPPIIKVSIVDNGLFVQWSSTDNHSEVYDYIYAVGDKPGNSNIVNWTSTTSDSALIENVNGNLLPYITVKARNRFGWWSEPRSAKPDSSIQEAKHVQNGARVTVTGIISAIYSDCYYIQEPGVMHGIKVSGSADGVEGQEVMVAGVVAYDQSTGERVLLPTRPSPPR